MGSACCVAARDRTITNGPNIEILQRNVRYSPSWSFRWENRGRVAGEETSVNWSDGISRSDGLDFKSGTTLETAYASEEGSPLNGFRTLAWQKSPVSEENSGVLRVPPSDPSISRDYPEVKELTGPLAVPDTSSTKPSPSVPCISSLSTSPLSSQGHLVPATSTPPRRPRHSPRLLRQVSDSRIPSLKSPNLSISEEEPSSFVLPGWSNESNRGSNGGSSDNWSNPPFSELMATSHRERWSFDSESCFFNRDKISRSSGRISPSASYDIQTCGVCSNLLFERSLWGSQKLIASNDLAVVAVLICGHVYHSECLENMTPEISKYDPACPVCTFGEKQTIKLSEKLLKAETDLKARNKKSKNWVLDNDHSSDLVFDRQKSSGPRMSSSSSMKNSLAMPFLRRHFSFGAKGSRSLSENHSTQKRGGFWEKSRKD